MIRIGRKVSARSVPRTTPRGVCGLWNVISPASGNGLTARILAPPFLAISSAESIRGWLVPGFCPMITISFAVWMSSRLTLPLPMPMFSASPTDVDSWHMFEQSGMLLVPKARANSW